MLVSTLGGYETVTVAKLNILVYLKPQRKKGKYNFKNGGKAPWCGSHYHENIAKFLNSKERNKLCSIKLWMYRDICECVIKERYLWMHVRIVN